LQMRAAIEADFGMDVSVVDVFGNATIRALVAHLERSGDDDASAASAQAERAKQARQFFARQKRARRQD
jgi:hypothetical protein